ASKPDTSLNPACSMPSTSTRNRNLRKGSLRSPAMLFFLSYQYLNMMIKLLLVRFLRDAENHEFRRLNRCNTDHANESAVVDIVLRHRVAANIDKERFLWSRSLQRAASPNAS